MTKGVNICLSIKLDDCWGSDENEFQWLEQQLREDCTVFLRADVGDVLSTKPATVNSVGFWYD